MLTKAMPPVVEMDLVLSYIGVKIKHNFIFNRAIMLVPDFRNGILATGDTKSTD